MTGFKFSAVIALILASVSLVAGVYLYPTIPGHSGSSVSYPNRAFVNSNSDYAVLHVSSNITSGFGCPGSEFTGPYAHNITNKLRIVDITVPTAAPIERVVNCRGNNPYGYSFNGWIRTSQNFYSSEGRFESMPEGITQVQIQSSDLDLNCTGGGCNSAVSYRIFARVKCLSNATWTDYVWKHLGVCRVANNAMNVICTKTIGTANCREGTYKVNRVLIGRTVASTNNSDPAIHWIRLVRP